MPRRYGVLLLFIAVLVLSVPLSLAQDAGQPVLRVSDVLPAANAVQVPTDTEITVFFNRPVVPLTLLGERDDLPNPLTLTPAVEGSGEWLSTSIYVFTPSASLAGGTTYTAEVSGVESTEGLTLQPFSWRFTTEALRVVSVEPEAMASGVMLDAPVTVRFNQPPNQASAEAAFSVVVEGTGAAVDGTFSWSSNGREMTFNVQPAFQLDTMYRAALDPLVIRPEVGDAPLAGTAPNWTFLTIPMPAILSTTPFDGQTDQALFGGFLISFASPMNETTLAERVVIEPEPEGGVFTFFNTYDNSFRVNFERQPSTTYTVTILPGMEDVYGNAIQGTRTVTFSTRDRDPEAQLKTPGQVGFYNAFSDRTALYLAYRNVDTVNLNLYSDVLNDLIVRLTDEDTYETAFGYEPNPANLVQQWSISGESLPLNARRYDLLELGTLLNTGPTSCPGALPSRLAPGDVGIVTTDPNPLRARVSPPDGEIVELMYRDYQFNVLEGPRCIEGIPWFQIELRDGTPVWVAESVEDEYLVEVRSAANRAPVPVQPLEGVDGALPPGAYFLMADSPQTDNRSPHFMIVSTVNVTLKYGLNEAVAWVTNVDTGEPLAGVPVRFIGPFFQEYGTATTNADGVALLNIPRVENLAQPLVAVVQTADNFGMGYHDWSRGLEPYEFNLSYDYYPERYASYLYTDRPVYRPGQPVYFRGTVREKVDLDYTLPPFREVLLRFYNDQGDVIEERREPLDDYGAFNGTFDIAADASLGNFRVNMFPPDDTDRSLGGLFFAVAEYRLPEYSVSVTAETPDVVRGDDLRALVESTYFFGGGVSNADVEYTVSAEAYRFNYEGPGRYSFTDIDPYRNDFFFPFPETLERDIASTDASGEALLTIGTETGEDDEGSQRYTVEATVIDESGIAVSGRANAIVHSGEFYVGVGLDSYVNRAGEAANGSVIAVDWDSQPLPETFVDITVEEWRYNTIQEVDGFGNAVFRSEVEQIEIQSETVVTGADGTAAYSFVPPNGGVYQITASATDDRGNVITASRTTWVTGSSYVPWRIDNERTIDLVADADAYNVGDTARILITSPYQGRAEAFITVERGRVLTTDHITLESNSTVYELPIEEGYSPNVFVSVMLVKGVDENNPIASFRYGLARLEVNSERREVFIEITPDREQAGPRDTVTYTVTTTDYTGEPVQAQVGVALTDLAALSIAPPNVGSIFERFFGLQQLSVRTSTPLTINTDEVTQFVEDVLKGGGGGGGGMDGIFEIRSEFVDTPFWNASLETDASGSASFEVTLPDNLTTWRLDARAVTRGTGGEAFRVGSETFDLIATKPLLVRPVTPRFFVVDDETTLAAVVNNNTGEDQTVTATIEAEGVTFVDGAEQTQVIPDGGRARFEWRVRVGNVEAVDATFTASAADGAFTDAAKPAVGQGDDRLLPVYRFDVRETVGTAGVLASAGDVTESIAIPPADAIGGGSLDVRLETSLAATTLDGLDYLRTYPHYCTEQTVSRFLPNIITYSALERLGIADAELKANLDEQVNSGLQTLYARQLPDGGWGWFTRDDSDILVTSYVLVALTEAQRAGYPVEPQRIADAQRYLRSVTALDGVQQLGGEDWQYNREAFALYALANSGDARAARLANLFDNRFRLNTEGRAYLALALHQQFPDDLRVATLVTEILNAAAQSASGTYWSSERLGINWTTDTRTTALALQTLVTVQPDSPTIPNVVRYLVSQRTADAWKTTQETAWSVMALTNWMEVSGELEANYTFSAVLNGNNLASDEAAPATLTDPLELEIAVADMLAGELNSLTISRDAGSGSGNLYYTAFLSAYLPVPQVEAVSNGISVSRRYVQQDPVTGEVIDSGMGADLDNVQVGDIVQVRLTVIVPEDMHYLLIEDPIPAGTEPIDPNLQTSAQVGTQPDLERLDVEDFGWGWWWFSGIEFRDDKVALYSTYLPAGTYEYVYNVRASVPGTYNVIPPTGEQFYFPDIYGRGAGDVFTVNP